MEIYIGMTLPNQRIQFTMSVTPGIVDRCELPQGSQENVENYINNEMCSIIFIRR
jgi:hypothetical protein